MLVKLSQVRFNPFRDLSSYPIDREKVEALKESIEFTGFWENLLGRTMEDESSGTVFEIAYGHHRKIALEEKYGRNYEFDLRIRELTDAQMIQIMAKENMDEWVLNPMVAMETVKVAKRFLEENPDVTVTVLRNRDPSLRQRDYQRFEQLGAGSDIISRFLQWPKQRVKDALTCLRAAGEIPERGEKKVKKEQKVLNKEDITKMPTQKHAVELVRATKSVKPSEKVKEKTIEQVKSSGIGTRDIKKTMTGLQNKEKPKKPKPKKQQKLDLGNFINECREDIDRLRQKIKTLMVHKEKFDSDYYSKTFAKDDFIYSAQNLMRKIGFLLEKEEEEKEDQKEKKRVHEEEEWVEPKGKGSIIAIHSDKKVLTDLKQPQTSDEQITFQRQLGRTMNNFDTLLADLEHERVILGCTGIDNFNFSIGFPSIHRRLETLLKRWHW